MAHPRSWRVPLGAATSRRTPGDCEVAGRGHPHGGILGTRSTVSPASQTPHTSNGVCVRAAWVRMVCARPRGGCQGVGNQRPGAPLAESAEGHPARPNRSGMPLSASGCPVVCDFKPPRQRPAACWAHTHEAPRSELALGRHQKITAHSLGHHPCGLVGEARLASNRRAGFTFEGKSDMEHGCAPPHVRRCGAAGRPPPGVEGRRDELRNPVYSPPSSPVHTPRDRTNAFADAGDVHGEARRRPMGSAPRSHASLVAMTVSRGSGLARPLPSRARAPPSRGRMGNPGRGTRGSNWEGT